MLVRIASLTLALALLSGAAANAQTSSTNAPSPATTPAPGVDGSPAPAPVPTQGVGAANPAASQAAKSQSAPAAIVNADATANPASASTGDQPVGPMSLDTAVTLSLARNHDVLLASLNALQAEQAYVVTRGVILPNLNFNAQIGSNYAGAQPPRTLVTGGATIPIPAQPSSTAGVFGAQLTISQLVFDGGAWWNNLDAAKLSFKSLQETADEQKLQTTYQVTQAFLELVRAQKQLAVFEEAARRSRDQADFEEKLYNGGKAAQSDVYAARANRDNDEINRLTGEALVETNRFALATLVGLDPAAPLSVAEPVELKDLPPPPPQPSRAIELALTTRPSLRAFEHALQSTQRTTSALKGRYYPSVQLQGSYSRNSQQFSDLYSTPLDEKNNVSGIIAINWNLFNGLADHANVEKSELLELSNENDLAQGKRQVASDVNTAIANLGGARQRAQVAGQSEDTAREGLRLAKARQQVGVGTELDVRDAELKLTQAQLAHVNALVDGREQLAALKRAMGGDPSAVGTPVGQIPSATSAAPRNIGG